MSWQARQYGFGGGYPGGGGYQRGMRDNEPEMSLEDLLENVKAMEAQIEDMKVPASCLQLAAAPDICICLSESKADTSYHFLSRWLLKASSIETDCFSVYVSVQVIP